MKDTEKRLIVCFLIMMLFYVIDSVISFFLPYNFTKKVITFVPSFSLLMFILLTMTLKDKTSRFFFSTICGFYYCMVYASSLVIYVMIYLLITFIRSYIYRNDGLNLIDYIIMASLFLMGKEIIVYVLMLTTKSTSLSTLIFIIKRLLPTLIGNIAFAPAIYFIFKKLNLKVEVDPYQDL